MFNDIGLRRLGWFRQLNTTSKRLGAIFRRADLTRTCAVKRTGAHLAWFKHQIERSSNKSAEQIPGTGCGSAPREAPPRHKF